MAAVWNTNVLLVEYPGYGEHFGEGITKTEIIVAESRIIMSFLTTELQLLGSDIIMYGYSMGTGVSTNLERYMSEPPSALILLAPYSSTADVVWY